MLRKPLLALLLAMVLGAGFACGLAHLFALRFSSGDVYPPYSTLRTDPLGAEALYEGVRELPGLEVRRNFKPLPKLRPPGGVTLFYAGLPHRAVWEPGELAAFDALVVTGSRAVFTFYPVDRQASEREDQREQEREKEKKKAKTVEDRRRNRKNGTATPAPAGKSAPKQKSAKADSGKTEPSSQGDGHEKNPSHHGEDDADEEQPFVEFAEVARRWGFTFGYAKGEPGMAQKQRALRAAGEEALEAEISWHGALCFHDLKPHWKVLYTCQGEPVVIERRYGSGSILLAADSFFVSNEALRRERSPQFLARLFAGPRDLVFDEEHHGVREQPGIASLARKYRLQGVMAGLGLLALLFVWQNAVRFIPAAAAGAEEQPVLGREAAQGMVNLLRRSIAPRDLLALCADEWRKVFRPDERLFTRFEEAFAAEVAAGERDPAAAYRRIATALQARR